MKIVKGLPDIVAKGTMVAIDTEFFGQTKGRLHRPEGTFACLTFCMDSKVVYMIQDEKYVAAALDCIKDGTWIMHNALYDLRQLRRYAKIKPRFVWDTMLAEQSMYGGYYQNFSLADLVRRWLGREMKKDVREDFSANEHMTKKMETYAAGDAVATLEIARLQASTFSDNPAFRAYMNIDSNLLFPLLDMPGFRVDTDRWEEMVTSFEEKGREIEGRLGINVYSQKQVIKEAEKHKLFLSDTRAETLNEHRDNFFIAGVLEARMYRKASSTYGKKWITSYVEKDGKVYSNTHITGAETGRMSESNPNKQQIPVRSLPGYRQCFIPSEGNVLLVADVVQQEPCILAYESQDGELLRAIKSGEDLHLAVARAIFGDPKMKKEDPRRAIGKTINLGTAYGLSEYGLAIRLGITEQEAARFLQQYFARFRDVFLWISTRRDAAFRDGYVSTVSGRRIHINPYSNQWRNNAINAPIQGGAADFTKLWVYNMWEMFRKARLPFCLVAIVHDEVVLDAPKGQVKKIRSIMEESFDATAKKLFPGVPFRMEIEQGRSWACKQLQSEIVEDEDD